MQKNLSYCRRSCIECLWTLLDSYVADVQTFLIHHGFGFYLADLHYAVTRPLSFIMDVTSHLCYCWRLPDSSWICIFRCWFSLRRHEATFLHNARRLALVVVPHGFLKLVMDFEVKLMFYYLSHASLNKLFCFRFDRLPEAWRIHFSS